MSIFSTIAAGIFHRFTRKSDLPAEYSPVLAYGWFVCLRADRPVMAGQRARMPALVPREDFSGEDSSGTAGTQGSSRLHRQPILRVLTAPACRNPQAAHRCSGSWTLWLCRRLGCYRRPARRPRSRADPRRPPRRRAAEGAQHSGLVGTRARADTLDQAAARPSGGPPDRPVPRWRRSPTQARSQEHSSASPASSRQTTTSEVDTCKKKAYRCFHEAL